VEEIVRGGNNGRVEGRKEGMKKGGRGMRVVKVVKGRVVQGENALPRMGLLD
jgi:hypothetical protein